MRRRRIPMVEGMEPRHLLAAGGVAAAAVGSGAATLRSFDITLKVGQGRARVETDGLGGVVTVPVAGRMDGFGPVVGRWVGITGPDGQNGREGRIRLHTARGSLTVSSPSIAITKGGTMPVGASGPIQETAFASTFREGGHFAGTRYSARVSPRVDATTQRVDGLTIQLTPLAYR